MTATPNLPPLPESAPSRYDSWGQPLPIYLADQMRAYALAAYQAGRDAGLGEGSRAFQIADQSMLELILCHGIPDESLSQGEAGSVGLVDQNSCEVATLEEADPAIQESYGWLHSRGLAEIIDGTDGETIYLKQVQI